MEKVIARIYERFDGEHPITKRRRIQGLLTTTTPHFLHSNRPCHAIPLPGFSWMAWHL